MKQMIGFIFISLISLALSQAAGAQTEADCSIDGKSFEDLTLDFVQHWGESVDFCQYKRLTSLNVQITRDMRSNAKRYDQRMKLMYAYGEASPAVNYLLITFQESWFNLFFNVVLKNEYDRAATETRWALGGGAGTALLLLSLPKMGKFSPKLIRFMRVAIRNLFQKRAIVLGGTSLFQQKKLLATGEVESVLLKFVPPPLLNAQSPTILDERADGVFLEELHEDFISAVGGIVGGTAAGYVPSLVVKKFAPNWETFFKGAWSRTWLARFASPGMITGTIVTFVASDLISDELAVYQFSGRMAGTQAELVADAAKITDAVTAGNELEIWRLGQRLRNDWALQRYMLSRELNQELEDIVNATLADLSGSICRGGSSDLLAQERPSFDKDVANAIKNHSLKLGVSIEISKAILSQLLTKPHTMTESLMASMNQNMMSDQERLDTKLTSEVLWDGVLDYLHDAHRDCASPQPAP